jgi:sec-independent protein translocase protein TatC
VARLLPRRLGHGEEAPLTEHLGELRSRLLVSVVAVGLAFAVTYAFHASIIRWLNQPLPPEHRHPVTFTVAEPFVTSVSVSMWSAVVIVLPVLMWQVWGFFAPAFGVGTQRMVRWLVLAAWGLVALGVVFGYWVVLPAAVHFLTKFDSHLYDIQIRAKDYYSFVTTVMLAVVVVFQLPMLMLGLIQMRVLSYQRLKKNRRLGYVLMAVIAVALPGIDPVTTTLEMLPLMVMFEGSIWMAWLIERRRAQRAALAPDDGLDTPDEPPLGDTA